MNGAFEFIVEGAASSLVVVELQGKERMNKAYAFDIVLVGPPIDAAAAESTLLGSPAHLALTQGESARWIHGVLLHFEREGVGGLHDEKHRYRARLVPAFRLMGKTRQSRIFQDRSVRDIVTSVLSESGVRQSWRLTATYAARRYCVQHQESDLHFVERLLREEGIFYWFEHPAGETQAEIMILSDVASSAPSSDEPLALRFRDSGGMTESSDVVKRFRLRHRVEPGRVHLKDFDFLRPSLDLSATADRADRASSEGAAADLLGRAGLQGSVAGARGAIDGVVAGARGGVDGLVAGARREAQRVVDRARRGATDELFGALPGEARSLVSGALGALGVTDVLEPADVPRPDELERYDHHGELEGGRVDPALARTHLEQYRRRALVGFGVSRAMALLPGHVFSLAGCPLEDHDGDYLVVAVDHEGHDPASFAADAGRAVRDVYLNSFVCVPVGVPFRPKRPRHRTQQVMETATIVGPAGSEIHADALGRIKVQFHWDRGGSRSENSSCWIRVMQPWAGAGWGVQFLPRVGMEVVVAFLAGDTDRPMVLGSTYNAEHPPPFPLPAEKTKSGIRTRSSRGGEGHSELSFDDRKGHERVHLRAQKDLDVLVRNNETHRVGEHHTSQIGGNQYVLVTGSRIGSVSGDATDLVVGTSRDRVDGDRHLDVGGGEVVVVGQSRSERIEADAHLRVGGREIRELEGSADLRAAHDYTLRVRGSFTTVVGDAEHPRATAAHTFGVSSLSASDDLDLRSDKGIHLTCGRSSIHILPDRVDIHAPDIGFFAAGARVVLGGDEARVIAKSKAVVQAREVDVAADGGSLTLTGDAMLRGGKISLKGSGSASDSPPTREVTPTRIELVDQDGHALANQRFVIHLDGGAQRVGVLDDHGKAELVIPASGPATISFPDAAEHARGSSGGMRPHVIQPGEYLTQLAFRHGFDAQAVWSASENHELHAQRANPEMLLPGDVLQIPAQPPPASSLSIGGQNRYTARVPLAEVTVRLVDHEGHALASEAYRVEGAGPPVSGTSDGEGNVHLRVPVTTREVQLVLPGRRAIMTVLVGHLDPIEHDSGVRQRLHSLGYLGGRPGPDEITGAIRRFQHDSGLEVTGDINDETRARLRERHAS